MIISPTGNSRGYPWASEPLLADDAKTVAHVWWPNGAIADTKGNVWTQNGTVPQVPGVMTTPSGAGPFSAANYYSLGTGSDVLDFSADFSICIVAQPASLGANVIAADYVANTSGWSLDLAGGGGALAVLRMHGSASSTPHTATNGSFSAGMLGVVCAGMTGTNLAIKQNLGTYTTTALTVVRGQATTAAASLGSYAAVFFPGTIYEAWFSTATPSDTSFTDMMNTVKAKLGIQAW